MDGVKWSSTASSGSLTKTNGEESWKHASPSEERRGRKQSKKVVGVVKTEAAVRMIIMILLMMIVVDMVVVVVLLMVGAAEAIMGVVARRKVKCVLVAAKEFASGREGGGRAGKNNRETNARAKYRRQTLLFL